MEEWQNEQRPSVEAQPIRTRWAIMLAEALEQVEEKYIMGSIDRETYHAELQELDAKLAIIGLSLASKPWAKTPGNRV